MIDLKNETIICFAQITGCGSEQVSKILHEPEILVRLSREEIKGIGLETTTIDGILCTSVEALETYLGRISTCACELGDFD